MLQRKDHKISLKDPNEFFNIIFIDLNNNKLYQNKVDNMFDQEILENYAAQILDANYEQNDTNKNVAHQKHLNIDQCHHLQQVLAKNDKPCDGSFDVYPHQKIHIYLFPDLEPVHHWAYLVACVHEHTLKEDF